MPTRPPRFPSALCSFALPALLLGFLLPACSSGSDGGEPLSYHQDIKPLVDRYCVGCHVQGGIGPFSLSTYDEVVRAADSVRSAVDAGRMPPWPPSADSRPLLGSRALPADHKAALLRWLDGPRAEGMRVRHHGSAWSRRSAPPGAAGSGARSRLCLRPQNSRDDDYHCFIYDPGLTADRFLLAGSVHPDNQRIVHHVIAYEIPESDAALIRGKSPDGQGLYLLWRRAPPPRRDVGRLGAGQPGHTHAGRHGAAATQGALIVVQVHYNVLAGPGQTDRTTMDLELTDTPPQTELHALPLARPKQLSIPPGPPMPARRLPCRCRC